jgi:hypothetical protein
MDKEMEQRRQEIMEHLFARQTGEMREINVMTEYKPVRTRRMPRQRPAIIISSRT